MEQFTLTISGESFTVNAPAGFSDQIVSAFAETYGFEPDTEAEPEAEQTRMRRFFAGHVRTYCVDVFRAWAVKRAKHHAAEQTNTAIDAQLSQLK